MIEDFKVSCHLQLEKLQLFGPGHGECLLMTFGRSLLVGIDCCRGVIQSEVGLASIVDRAFEYLDPSADVIWILTHFHLDHFLGLSEILRKHGDNISELIIPLDYTSADLDLAAAKDAKKDTERDDYYHQARAEISRLRRYLMSPKLQKAVRSFSGHYKVLNGEILDGGVSIRFQIDVFGPTYRNLAHLIGKGVGTLASGSGSANRAKANEGSYIVRVLLGSSEALFLGDSPANLSEPIISTHDLGIRRLSHLKVSHHGASDGTSEELLQRLNIVPGGFALIAPFKRQRLPRRSVLKLLEEANFSVRVSDESEAQELRGDIVASTGGICPPLSIKKALYTRPLQVPWVI